uniref:Uncharacterized protein n=1 Tax=Solanum tuberosum TaxID=4113 RepID=M1BIJ5_SOLTU
MDTNRPVTLVSGIYLVVLLRWMRQFPLEACFKSSFETFIATGTFISYCRNSSGKDLLIPRGRVGLEASYLFPISPRSFNWTSLRFLDCLLPNAVPPIFWFPLGVPCSQVNPMAARKGDLVLYSGDIFPSETRKLPSCPRAHFVNRKRKPTHLSAPLVNRCSFMKRLSTVHSH